MKVFGQAVLKGALTPGHLAQGLFLDEIDDHTVALLGNGEIVARYSATGVRIEKIREDADLWIARQK